MESYLPNNKWLRTAIAAAISLNLMSCAARYGTKRPNGEAAIAPQKAIEDTAEQMNDPSSVGPTAGIEVVVDGQIVTQIPVGVVATIRPSKDTKDGDNAAQDGCAHPGIISASYLIGGQIKLDATSTDGCDSLEVQHQFASAGIVEIELIVTSDESETAKASASISVVDSSSTTPPAPSLRIQGSPLETNVGEEVNFEALCIGQSGTPELNWDLGDGKTAQGTTTKHSYTAAGSIYVQAICKIDNQVLKASATVIVRTSIQTITHENGTGSDGSGESGKGSGSGSSSGNPDSGGSGTSTGGGSGGSSSPIPDEDDNGSSSGSGPGQNPSQRPNQN